ncbi:MAG: hypothetical protein C3F11_11120 [Methylocystaceae bacterium]|nr:MAG: hypothetical protein C3F11_11120 [Methylocystaceae bacterium]
MRGHSPDNDEDAIFHRARAGSMQGSASRHAGRQALLLKRRPDWDMPGFPAYRNSIMLLTESQCSGGQPDMEGA